MAAMVRIVHDDRPRPGRASRCTIFIDGMRAAALGPGQPVDVTVTVGSHELQARDGWRCSAPVQVQASEGTVRRYRVRRRSAALALSSLIHPRSGLLFEEQLAPSPAPGAASMSRGAG